MADFTGTTTVAAADDVLFAFLSDVHNLPKYFARMTSAEPGEGNEVRTTAALPDGRRSRARRGSRSPTTPATSPGAPRARRLPRRPRRPRGRRRPQRGRGTHPLRAGPEDTDGSIQGGVDETLAAIKQLVERADALE